MKNNNFISKSISQLLNRFGLINYSTNFVHDNPPHENIRVDRITIVGGKDYVKWAYLRCPCGCNEIIMLSLIKGANPSWRIWIDKLGRPTISPSIWRTEGCRSHFIIKSGKLIWAKSTWEN
ncbi:MAG: DUF6527 family protein [Bacteroidia bacterium]|nr:DUF6527 family protein [Bacteroidia bacterium]